MKIVLADMVSKRDQLKARVKSLFLEELSKSNPSITLIKGMGFDYKGIEEDLHPVAIDWAEEGISRMKVITPKSEAEGTFIKMFDGIYADVWFEEYPNSIFFFKDDSEYWFHLKNSWFWCSHKKIWSIIENEYSMEYKNMQYLIRPLVEEAFRLRGVTPYCLASTLMCGVEDAFRLRGKQ